MKLRIKTLFDQKHIVATVSALIVLLTVIVFGVDAVVSGAAGNIGADVVEIEAPITPAEDAQASTPTTSDVASDSDSSTSNYGVGSPSPNGGAPADEPADDEPEDDEPEASGGHSKIGEVIVSAGGVTSSGTMNS